MKQLSLLLLLGGTVGLGMWLGWRYLHRVPNKPGHSATHLLMGVAGLELLVMLRRGAPDGTVLTFEVLGNAAAILLLTAVMSGLLSPIIGRHWGRKPATMVLVVHALLGGGGFLLMVAWLIAG